MPGHDATESALIESIGRLETLQELWRGQPGTGTILALDGSVQRALMINVLARHAVALTDAVLLLVRQRMYVEAAPLIRQTLECAVTAAWMAITPHSLEALADESGRQRTAMEADLKKVALWAGFESATHGPTEREAEAIEQFLAYRTEAAKNFEKRCSAFPGAPWLYLDYRWLSQFSHATTHLLATYVHQEDDDHTLNRLRFTKTSAFPHPEVLLQIQVLVLHAAFSAWDATSLESPDRHALASLGDELGVTWNLLYPAST